MIRIVYYINVLKTALNSFLHLVNPWENIHSSLCTEYVCKSVYNVVHNAQKAHKTVRKKKIKIFMLRLWENCEIVVYLRALVELLTLKNKGLRH